MQSERKEDAIEEIKFETISPETNLLGIICDYKTSLLLAEKVKKLNSNKFLKIACTHYCCSNN